MIVDPKTPIIKTHTLKPYDILCDKSVEIDTPVFKISNLTITDIQNFFCKFLIPNHYKIYPRWCRLTGTGNCPLVNVTVIEGINSRQFNSLCLLYNKKESCRNSFNKFMEIFSCIRFINPAIYGFNWNFELFQIPLAFLYLSRLEEYFNIATSNSLDETNHIDSFPRTQLLLGWELFEIEKIPYSEESVFKYLFEMKEVTDQSPLFAVDCEMVECQSPDNPGVFTKELVAITLVNENREIVYSTYVKPKNQIVNYLTPFSGVDYEILKDVKVTLEEVQKTLFEILPKDAILVGQHIYNDLKALQICYPYLIDTSVIYNNCKIRKNKSKLKHLVKQHLKRDIQNNTAGHSSSEDAIATMDLLLLKLSKYHGYGDILSSQYQKEIVNKSINFLEIENYEESFYNPNLKEPVMEVKEPSFKLHKNALVKLNQEKKTLNLVDHILKKRQSYFKVKTVYDSKIDETFQESWIDMNEIKEHNSMATMKSAGMNINILKYHKVEEDMTEDRWMKLLTKIIEEHQKLPAYSLDNVIFINDETSIDDNYGKIFYGVKSKI